MKRLTALILTASLLLAGCAARGGEQTTNIDPEQAAAALTEAVDFRDVLVQADGDAAELYYRLDDTIDSYAIYMSGSGATAEEVAVLKVKDPADLPAAKSIVEKRVEDLKFNFEDYVPAEMRKLENPVILTSGDVVLLVIADDAAAAKKAAEDLLNG